MHMPFTRWCQEFQNKPGVNRLVQTCLSVDDVAGSNSAVVLYAGTKIIILLSLTGF